MRDSYSSNMIKMLITCLEEINNFAISKDPPNLQSTNRVLNSIRILTRLFPFIFELPFDSPLLLTFESLFWDQRELGKQLILNIVNLLFLRGFCHLEVVSDTPGVHYVIWYKGVASANAPSDSAAINSNRLEVLRLLLTILSNQMYCKPSEITAHENKWFNIFAFDCCLEKRAVLALLCSLLNSYLRYQPYNFIPYSNMLYNDTIDESLALFSVNCLISLIDVSSGIIGGTESTDENYPKIFNLEKNVLIVNLGV